MTITTKSYRVAIATLFAMTVSAGAALAATCPGPDTAGHTCADQACVDVATPTCIGNVLFDDSCTARAVGFSFKHYGNIYSTVGVASNGYLDMGGCNTGTDFTNDCPIPNTLTENDAIYGVWDDLNNGGTLGGICEGLTGTAPNRVYAVEYTNVPYFSGGGTATFQIQIDENGGTANEAKIRIDVRSAGQPTSYTSGLENFGGTDGITRFCNNATAAAVCTQYAPAAPPSTTCNLAPIEAKLDIIGPKITNIETRVVDIQTQVTSINSDVDVKVSSRASQTSVDALETKADALSLDLQVAEAKLDTMPCDVFNLLLGVLIDSKKVPTTHPCYVP